MESVTDSMCKQAFEIRKNEIPSCSVVCRIGNNVAQCCVKALKYPALQILPHPLSFPIFSQHHHYHKSHFPTQNL